MRIVSFNSRYGFHGSKVEGPSLAAVALAKVTVLLPNRVVNIALCSVSSALCDLLYLAAIASAKEAALHVSPHHPLRFIPLLPIPTTDLIIASLAMEYNCSVFAIDPHFDQIPDINLLII